MAIAEEQLATDVFECAAAPASSQPNLSDRIAHDCRPLLGFVPPPGHHFTVRWMTLPHKAISKEVAVIEFVWIPLNWVERRHVRRRIAFTRQQYEAMDSQSAAEIIEQAFMVAAQQMADEHRAATAAFVEKHGRPPELQLPPGAKRSKDVS